jgi:hypothetical protein
MNRGYRYQAQHPLDSFTPTEAFRAAGADSRAHLALHRSLHGWRLFKWDKLHIAY